MARLTDVLFLAVILSVLSGCAHRHATELLGELQPGMSPTEVQAVLGPPVTVRSKYDRQAWLYCHDLFGLRIHTALTIWYEKDHLRDVSVYHNNRAVWCSDFLQTFRWSSGPYESSAKFK